MLIALAVVNGISPGAADGSTPLLITAGIAGVIVLYLQIKQSHRLAKAFGKGFGYTLFLIVFDRLGRVVLGFGNARYRGKRY